MTHKRPSVNDMQHFGIKTHPNRMFEENEIKFEQR